MRVGEGTNSDDDDVIVEPFVDVNGCIWSLCSVSSSCFCLWRGDSKV